MSAVNVDGAIQPCIVTEEPREGSQWKLGIQNLSVPKNKMYNFNKMSTARKGAVKKAIKANPDVRFGANHDIEHDLDAFHGELLFTLSEESKKKLRDAFEDITEDRQWKYVEDDGHIYAKHHPKILRELCAKKLFHILETNKPEMPGVKVHPDEVLIFPYSSTAIMDKVLVTMSKPNGVVLSPEGFYKNNALICHNAGLTLVPIPVNWEREGRVELDVFEEYVRKYHREGTLAGCMFTFPGNPLIIEYTVEELKKMSEIMIRHNVPAVVDSIFFGAVHPGRITQLASIEVEVDGKMHRMYDHVVTISGNSKSFQASGPSKFGAACTGNKAWREKLKHLMSGLLFQRESTHLAKTTLLNTTPEDIAEHCELMLKQQNRAQDRIALINEKYGSDTLWIAGSSNYGMFKGIGFNEEMLTKAGITDNWQLEDLLLTQGGLDTVSFAYVGSAKMIVRLNVYCPRKNGIKTGELVEEIFDRIDGVIAFLKNGGTYLQAVSRLGLEPVSLEKILS